MPTIIAWALAALIWGRTLAAFAWGHTPATIAWAWALAALTASQVTKGWPKATKTTYPTPLPITTVQPLPFVPCSPLMPAHHHRAPLALHAMLAPAHHHHVAPALHAARPPCTCPLPPCAPALRAALAPRHRHSGLVHTYMCWLLPSFP
ncbi:hypothetical protein BC826DRAFT_1113846 [Russula brevipes]|nr:hypothetical protein BC826DRAFT_1113846 [Russula brevipes]